MLVFPILIKKISKTYDPLMILSPSLLLPKRKLFVSPIPAEMVRTSKCHDWKNFKNAVMIVRHSWQNLIPMLRNCRKMPGRVFFVFEFYNVANICTTSVWIKNYKYTSYHWRPAFYSSGLCWAFDWDNFMNVRKLNMREHSKGLSDVKWAKTIQKHTTKGVYNRDGFRGSDLVKPPFFGNNFTN